MSITVDTTADVSRAHKNVRCLKGSEGVTAYMSGSETLRVSDFALSSVTNV